MKASNGFVYDRLSRPIFGKFQPGDDIKLDTVPHRVDGYFSLGSDIVNDGNIFMSEGDWLSRSPDAKPIMGVVHLKSGVPVEKERDLILSRVPGDVVVLTPSEAVQRENSYTMRSAPVGILFLIGMLAGLVIGTINCYQVLYNEITDLLPQFATLKAMGFSNGFLRRVILEQATVLALTGFAAGTAFAWFADRYIAGQSMLPIRITVFSGTIVFALTVLMCMIAGLFAIRRAAVADPASLY